MLKLKKVVLALMATLSLGLSSLVAHAAEMNKMMNVSDSSGSGQESAQTGDGSTAADNAGDGDKGGSASTDGDKSGGASSDGDKSGDESDDDDDE